MATTAIPPYPGRQLFILGESNLRETCFSHVLTRRSTLPDMRAHRLHVHLPIYLPHGKGLQPDG